VPGGGRRGDVVRRRPVSSFGSVPIFAYHRDAVSVRLLSSGWELMGSEMSSERGPARWALVDCSMMDFDGGRIGDLTLIFSLFSLILFPHSLKTCAEKAPAEMGKYVDCLEYHR